MEADALVERRVGVAGTDPAPAGAADDQNAHGPVAARKRDGPRSPPKAAARPMQTLGRITPRRS